MLRVVSSLLPLAEKFSDEFIEIKFVSLSTGDAKLFGTLKSRDESISVLFFTCGVILSDNFPDFNAELQRFEAAAAGWTEFTRSSRNRARTRAAPCTNILIQIITNLSTIENT